MIIALVSGFWGQNIGNAFFNIGGKWILEQVFPKARINYILDQPGYRTFNNQSKGNPKNDWGLLKRLEVDAIVLEGPMLTVDFPGALGRDLCRPDGERNQKLSSWARRCSAFNEEERRVNAAFLKKYRPWILSNPRLSKLTKHSRIWRIMRIRESIVRFFVSKAYKPFFIGYPTLRDDELRPLA